MASQKLTKAQAGQLGGYAAARSLGPEGVADRASKGGLATLEKYGKEAMVRAAHARWGRKVKGVKEAREAKA